MNHKFRFVILAICLGMSLALAALKVYGMTGASQPRTWQLEALKPGQASIFGRQQGSGFGGTLAVGDVNNDGYADLITSARFASENSIANGDVFVIPGPLSFNQVYTMPHQAGIIFHGEGGIQLGVYLDSGDMNGDKIDDIVMGGATYGKTFVYLGSPGIQATATITIPTTANNMALTVNAGREGLVLCDFNADGNEDLFLETIVYNTGEMGLQVWGFLGRETLSMTHPTTLDRSDVNIVFQGFAPTIIHSPNQRNMACGDIDGDGNPDLAIGMYGESPSSRLAAGIVYLMRGDPEITITSPVTITVPDQAGAIIEGEDGGIASIGDALGESLVAADVNHDGRADLILGAPGASGYAGEVYLWTGRPLLGQRFTITSQSAWTVHGDETMDSLGKSIATGDFDGDGDVEILLGCSNCAPQGEPFYLIGSGYVLEPLQLSGNLAVTAASQLDILPYPGGYALGWSADAVDLDGDGVQDLILGAPAEGYPEFTLPGAVFAISYPFRFNLFLPSIHR